jgi:chorismate synthase
MASNSFGDIFRFTTWGESHGEAIGCVVDGVPSLIDLEEKDIQQYLDLRKPGQSKFTTQRQEADEVKILSGVFEGKTTGTPISLIIYNQNQKSKDYGDIKDKFRPNHADLTYQEKYGIRDYRGGGRSSARETAMRVAAGAIARKVLGANIIIEAALINMGEIDISTENWNYQDILANPFYSSDKSSSKELEEYLSKIRKEGSSVGGTVEVRIKGVPIGLGDPVYDKLDSKIANALMSINAAKAVEIGNGFESAGLRGEENADEMSADENGNIEFTNNNSGGILGGISSSQEIVARVAIKPTSSILIPRNTIDIKKQNTDIVTKGRHDPCVAIRAVPVVEAMIANVLADSFLKNRIYQ